MSAFFPQFVTVMIVQKKSKAEMPILIGLVCDHEYGLLNKNVQAIRIKL